MILITGGTGFVGRTTMRHLSESGYNIRTLIRPSKHSPRLPCGIETDISLASLADWRGVRASLVGVDIVIHLAGAEKIGMQSDLDLTEVEGARVLAEASADAGVKRLIYLSHLGAERTSAYPLLRAKGKAEEYIRRSGVSYTILRSGIVFGEEDHFTSSLAMMITLIPFVFPLPGSGSTVLQPLWVEDLATCIVWALNDAATERQTYEIGGPEFLTFSQVVRMVMKKLGRSRLLIPVAPPYLRAATRLMERLLPDPPATTFWLDYLATNRAADLGTLPRVFRLQPSRMEERIDYLRNRTWSREFIQHQMAGRHRKR